MSVLPAKLRYLRPEVLQHVGAHALVARNLVEGLRVGSHRSRLRGFSTEFAHHRPYSLGDPIRHIDWRVFARSERYYTKLYEAETNFEAHFILDASSSMRYGSGPLTKLEYAKHLAVTLAYLVLEQRDSVALGVFDADLRSYLPPSGTRSNIYQIDQRLQEADPVPKTDIAAPLHELAQRISRRGLVLLFSDLFDEPEKLGRGIDHLRSRGNGVVVFHILDAQELTLGLEGTVRFVGLEGEPELIAQPRRIREAYQQEVRRFTQELRDVCAHRAAEYVLVDTSRPLEQVIAGFLAGQGGAA